MRLHQRYLARATSLKRRHSGLPPGLTQGATEHAFSALTDRPCTGFRYTRLAHSPTGEEAYRLFATAEDGPTVSAVYRSSPLARAASSRLDAAIYEANKSFEMPERLVLASVNGTSLSRFVPKVLWIESTLRALQYIVEDLDGESPSRDQLITVAGGLPRFHGALFEWAETVQAVLASRYQHYFAKIAITMQAILRELADSGNQSAAVLLDGWQTVVGIQSALDRGHNRRPIHGDLHRWNVFLPEDSRASIKVIDWDSVVWGSPYIDLATLLIDESPDLQTRALHAYLAGETAEDQLAAQERLFFHARFHVSLLWACLFASDRRWSRRASVANRHLDEAARLLRALA